MTSSVSTDASREARSDGPSEPALSWRDGRFLIEEYKALTEHYMHEDMFYLRALGLFSTANVALLTIHGSSLLAKAEPMVRLAFPLIGLISTTAWAATLYRLRHVRRHIEQRIREIEEDLARYWANDPPPFPIMRLRARLDHGNPFTRLRASTVMLLLPVAFALIWVLILAVGLRA